METPDLLTEAELLAYLLDCLSACKTRKAQAEVLGVSQSLVTMAVLDTAKDRRRVSPSIARALGYKPVVMYMRE